MSAGVLTAAQTRIKVRRAQRLLAQALELLDDCHTRRDTLTHDGAELERQTAVARAANHVETAMRKLEDEVLAQPLT